MILEILIFIVTAIFVNILYLHKKAHKYLDSRDVRYLPGVPGFGNSLRTALFMRHPVEDLDEVYKAFPDEKYVGFLEGNNVIILIKDVELVKKITVKDFDHFTDHRMFTSDKIFNDSLLMMKGDRWRELRNLLSPAFTGSKMRQMMPFMTETSDNIIEYLIGSNCKELDVDDLIHRYSNDVIASTAFGLRINSLVDRHNDFYTIGQSLVKADWWVKIKMMFLLMLPFLGRYVTFFPPKTMNFFRNLVVTTMEYREKNNILRPDMIQLMIEAGKGTLKADSSDDKDEISSQMMTPEKRHFVSLSQDDIAAQAFIFFFAGFETSASTIVMIIHELALLDDIQLKLYQEVREHRSKHSTLTYENLQELKYMDAVINESLRKWSPAIVLDRTCTKAYTLPPPHDGGKPLQVKVGDIVQVCVNSIQMDERFYPKPEKFDPERFMDNNPHQYTFMPFGVGPRICIGSRFALMEVKVLLFKILLQFDIQKSVNTLDPIILEATNFNIKANGGTKVRFVKRNN